MLSAATFGASFAQAEMRPIFVPGKLALVLMQGVSSGGFDPEPRALYDSFAMPEEDVNGAGKAKGLKTVAQDFVLACGTKGTVKENVTCTINLKPSERSIIDYMKQTAEITVTGEEASLMYERCAGVDATEPFTFKSENGWLTIESTRERFYFRFAK